MARKEFKETLRESATPVHTLRIGRRPMRRLRHDLNRPLLKHGRSARVGLTVLALQSGKQLPVPEHRFYSGFEQHRNQWNAPGIVVGAMQIHFFHVSDGGRSCRRSKAEL